MDQYDDSVEYLERVARGETSARLISRDSFIRLFDLAAENGRILDGFEPFRIEGDLEVAHPELTVTPHWFHHHYRDLSWDQRYGEMKRIIRDTIQDIEHIGGEFRFYAWTSKRGDWID